jgi:hypothetical protein
MLHRSSTPCECEGLAHQALFDTSRCGLPRYSFVTIKIVFSICRDSLFFFFQRNATQRNASQRSARVISHQQQTATIAKLLYSQLPPTSNIYVSHKQQEVKEELPYKPSPQPASIHPDTSPRQFNSEYNPRSKKLTSTPIDTTELKSVLSWHNSLHNNNHNSLHNNNHNHNHNNSNHVFR